MKTELIIKPLNWIAKSISVIMLILLLMFMFGEGIPQIGEKSPRELILLICMFILIVGMFMIWWKEKAAAYTIMGSSTAFWLINAIYSGGFWFHWLFLIFPLIGGLLLFTINKASGKAKPRRK